MIDPELRKYFKPGLKRNTLGKDLKIPKFDEDGPRAEIDPFVAGAFLMRELYLRKVDIAAVTADIIRAAAHELYPPRPPLDEDNNKGRTGQ